MGKTIGLLSGKGGSGKTTLALSISALVSHCGLKVLLIDCDLSTNGATYFYESKLTREKKRGGSFYELITKVISSNKIQISPIKISEYMDFLPSVSKITKANPEVYRYDPQDTERFASIVETLKNIYDVLIFDCQAGYTEMLEVLLPYVDTNLVVMEPDAISSAAIRSLYLKVGEKIDGKKTFQVFNKVTKDEYEIYGKISGGTTFTNIDSILFDWTIRKAFAISQIPDMESTSAKYGEQIYNICNVLFKEDGFQEKLGRFGVVLEIDKLNEQAQEIKEKMKGYSRNRNAIFTKTLLFACAAMPLFILILYSTYVLLIERKPVNSLDSDIFVFLLSLYAAFSTCLYTFYFSVIYSRRMRLYNQINKDQKKVALELEKNKEILAQFDEKNLQPKKRGNKSKRSVSS